VFHADRETTRADGRTDKTKIIVDPRNFVNAPKKVDIGKNHLIGTPTNAHT